MDTWLSDKRPLLSLVLDYLELQDVQRWRLAGTFAKQHSDACITPNNWQQIVRSHPSIVKCPICPQLHRRHYMFPCPICQLFTCGSHVMTCNTCMVDICSVCAQYRHQCAGF